MKNKSRDGSAVQDGLNLSDKMHLKMLAFALVTHDLMDLKAVEIVGNSKLKKDGPTGVIVFIANATIGPNNIIEYPLAILNGVNLEIANAENEIANAKKQTEVNHEQKQA